MVFLLSILLKAKTTDFFLKNQIIVQHWKLQSIEMAQ
jgi:hypothetical protein